MRILILAVLLVGGAFAAELPLWGVFEAEFDGPSSGKPFTEVEFSAAFTHGGRSTRVRGFYDGGGRYRIRFMPDATGEWRYRTTSNRDELDGQTGVFQCTRAGADSHGPVRVRDTFHFAYADGTPYFPFGTTVYAFVHQGDEQEERTLDTLKTAGFNKLRLCVFPKDYSYSRNEPVYYPYERKVTGEWDFDRFDPAYWRHLEERIRQLGELGIEADLILWHPYDRWRHSFMTAEQDFRYLRYAIARLAAYRNIWWSLANEYDFMLKRKPMERWDRFFEILQQEDPHQHLRSVHNGSIKQLYDYSRDWVTHVSIQHFDVQRVHEWRHAYGNPVIDDECEYEGNVPQPWGNISARELVHRFWVMVIGGGYATHGETYMDEDDVLWWSKGGTLHGESTPRIAFLRRLVEERRGGLTPMPDNWIWTRVSGAKREGEYLLYFGPHQPIAWTAGLPKTGRYMVEVIDTWNMAVTPLPGPMTAPFQIPLPGKPYLAVRIRSVE